MLGVKDISVRKRLLQETKVNIDQSSRYCRSSETTSKQLKDMSGINEKSADYEISALKQQYRRREPPIPQGNRRCKFCGENHEWDKTSCPAYGKSCRNCGIQNHFAKVCQRRSVTEIHHQSKGQRKRARKTRQDVLAVQTPPEKFKNRIVAVLSIKGGNEA